MKPDVSIIIVTWNAKKFVAECLGSLNTSQGSLPAEIIVVDNASSDGTPDLVCHDFPQVRLVRNDKNLGFARANNIGMALSKGKYVCLINSDVNVPADCIPLLVGYMEQHPKVGIAGPQMLAPNGAPARSTMRFPTLWNSFCRALDLDSIFAGSKWFRSFLMVECEYDRIQEVQVLNGWFWITRREALNEVGLLDEQFFMYAEDIDWSYRFHKAGWEVVYCPIAWALHYGGASSARTPVRFYVAMRQAGMQYWAKHHGLASVGAYWLLTCFHEAVRVAGYGATYFASRFSRSEDAFKVKRSLACIRWLAGLGAEQTH